MINPKQYAEDTFLDFVKNGNLPDEVPVPVLSFDFEDDAMSQAIHYLGHVVTDKDIRGKDPELDEVMRSELRKILRELGYN